MVTTNNKLIDSSFFLQMALTDHFDNFLEIYNDIKKEAMFISNDLLSNDLSGFKNVFCLINQLIENSVDVYVKSNDEFKDESDIDEDINEFY